MENIKNTTKRVAIQKKEANLIEIKKKLKRITDNKAVLRLIRRYDFINVVKIKKAQHEILIEKETIRKEAMSVIHEFIDS